MSAAEDDTELRDLLIQNLENSGVLNKLKAEMRAAVFLAMEEQDKLENKAPLINENLKKCLNTKDGRLVASLVLDFLQVFNLDFSLAVFQPEINCLSGLDSRDLVCRELDLSESEANRKSPLLLELVRRGRHKEPQEPSQKQIAHARKTFDNYDKDGSGSVGREDLGSVFTDLFPELNKSMLDTFLTDELRAADRAFNDVDLQLFLGLYKRLFTECRSVVVHDSDASPRSRFPEEKVGAPPVSKIPRYKGQSLRGQSQTAAQDSPAVASLGKGDFQQQVSKHSEASDNRTSSSGLRRDRLDLDLEDELDDGDSFFDDPLPKPQKTYGCIVPVREDCLSGLVVSPMRRGRSLSDLSVLADSKRDGLCEGGLTCELRKAETCRDRVSPAGSMSESPRPGGGTGRGAGGGGGAGAGGGAAGGGAGGGGGSASEQSLSRNGASNSREPRDPKTRENEKTGSAALDDDVEYDDDFNSHRSDLSRSELSIGEEIEEVSIEGPDHSEKFDETTQDLSVSQLSQSHGADYMEEVT